MDPAIRVENLIGKWQDAGHLSRPQEVYAKGVAEKWRQVLYTLNHIRNLDTPVPVVYTGATGTAGNSQGLLDRDGEIRYYCDILWMFLYSTLDILAQVVNVVTGSLLAEEDTDFLQMVNHLNQTNPGCALQQRLETLKRSRAYKNLREFRRCVTHRRAVYIEALGIQAWGTPGYETATTTISGIKRFICDNPLALTPKVAKGRELVPFCESVVNQIAERLDKVLLALSAVR